MNHKKHGLLLLAATLLFSFSVAAQTNNLAPVNSVKKELAIERLKKNVPELMKAANVPGLSLALIRDGKLYFKDEGKDFELTRTGKDRFAFEQGELIFVPDAKGEIEHIFMGLYAARKIS